jgi:hypothetical protein
MPALQLETKRK